MSSSNKTGHLHLNNWNGSDKPLRDDFNSDNVIIDNAIRLLDTAVGDSKALLTKIYLEDYGNDFNNLDTGWGIVRASANYANSPPRDFCVFVSFGVSSDQSYMLQMAVAVTDQVFYLRTRTETDWSAWVAR